MFLNQRGSNDISSSDDEAPLGNKRKVKKPNLKKKAQGAKAKQQAGRGVKVPTKQGHKKCNECGVEKPLGDFKIGNSTCTYPCVRMKDNIYNACKKENLLDWSE